MQDSVNGLWLEGWDDKSVWGYDTGTQSYFAQLTRNGNSDDDGPDIVRATGAGPMVVCEGDVHRRLNSPATCNADLP
ncbi:hypothetical protein [Catellatospora sp. NPDC049609]|uniref:hypothetical protein n=1 Tax=Catellatospora sp. NPDC049609 TaxID=3155505 RepID=UPI00343F9678